MLVHADFMPSGTLVLDRLGWCSEEVEGKSAQRVSHRLEGGSQGSFLFDELKSNMGSFFFFFVHYKYTTIVNKIY
jgi:hypothetical protein